MNDPIMPRPAWVARVDAAAEAMASVYPLTIAADGSVENRERLRPKTIAEILRKPMPTWRIIDVLPERGLSVMYGQPGSGKTFAALDLGLSVSRGVRWFGRRVKRCGVIYIAAEGNLQTRLAAYFERHAIEPDGQFRIVDCAVNLLLPNADVPALIDAIKAVAGDMGGVGVIIIDTLNRVMPGGDENSSEDMGAVIASAKRIEEAFGCVVLFIHHSGKDQSRGGRGHSSLKGACDVELEVIGDGAVRTLESVKARDSQKLAQVQFSLDVVDLGPRSAFDPQADEHERITSCVVVPDLSGPAAATTEKLPPAATIGLQTLRNLISDKGERMPNTSEIPGGTRGVRLLDWRDRFLTAYGEKSAGDKKSCDRTFRRVRDDLLKAKLIGMHDPFVWLW